MSIVLSVQLNLLNGKLNVNFKLGTPFILIQEGVHKKLYRLYTFEITGVTVLLCSDF